MARTTAPRNAIDARLGSLAARRHGLLTTADLAAAGIGDTAVRTRRAAGRWTAERRGVVSIAGLPPTFEGKVMAAVLGHPNGKVFAAGPTAARIWPTPCPPESSLINLLTVDPAKARGDGIATRRTRVLVPADHTVRDGIPLTSYARTLIDLSGRNDLSDRQLGWILDHGIRLGHTSIVAVRHTLDRLRPGPGRRTSRIESLLEARGERFDPGASQPEATIAGWLEHAGFPRPEHGVRVVVGGIEWELDGAYRDLKIAFDYHSVLVHAGDGNVETFHKDYRKALALKADGWDYSVFTSATSERAVVETIATAIAARSPATS
jgi:hypothetical protein